jgi:hypothetical protein
LAESINENLIAGKLKLQVAQYYLTFHFFPQRQIRSISRRSDYAGKHKLNFASALVRSQIQSTVK